MIDGPEEPGNLAKAAGIEKLTKAQKRRRRRKLLTAAHKGEIPLRTTSTPKKGKTARIPPSPEIQPIINESPPTSEDDMPPLKRSQTWQAAEEFDNGVMNFPKRHREPLYFSGAKCPLSNFYPMNFVYKGKTYKSLEHAYQCMKARCARTVTGENTIYKTKTAAKAKLAAKWLTMSKTQKMLWRCCRVALMKELLQHKFQQCPAFRHDLKAAGGLELWEATKDEFWACGLMQHELARKIPNKPPGQNVLGKLLMELEIRSTLKK